MDDAKFSFIEDIKDRKSMSSGARHKKVGSKSKKCTLPSDMLSQKQKRELNGEVKSYPMNRPMTWKEFKEYPDDLQETYLACLVDGFNVSSVQIGSMMGVSGSTINRMVREKGYKKVSLKKGKRNFSKEDIDSWHEFLGDWPTGHISYKNQTDASVHDYVEDVVGCYPEILEESDTSEQSSEVVDLKISEFSVGYEGEIILKDVFEYVQLMLGDSFKGHLKISYVK